jgi:Uma2 family endonuclease
VDKVWIMIKGSPQPVSQGPFRAEQLRSGDPYELSNGHPVHCLPTGGRGSRATTVGGAVVASDPAVEVVGMDTGYSPSPEVLRAPDVSVGDIPDQPGWVQGAPLLALEYADTGQDEDDLQVKIQELLAAGTRYLWVVRLTGPRRIEVHQPGQKMRIAHPGELLEAPGVLANPVPVEALYDREAARPVILRNLLQREGYGSLDEIRAEGEAQGRAEGEIQGLREAVIDVLTGRGLEMEDELQTALAGAKDPALLRAVLRRAATASIAEILAALQAEP